MYSILSFKLELETNPLYRHKIRAVQTEQILPDVSSGKYSIPWKLITFQILQLYGRQITQSV